MECHEEMEIRNKGGIMIEVAHASGLGCWGSYWRNGIPGLRWIEGPVVVHWAY